MTAKTYEPSALDRRLIEHPVEVATVVGVGAAVVVGVPGIVVLGWFAGLALAVGLGLVMVLMAIGMSRSMRRQVGRPQPVLTQRRWWWWLSGPMFSLVHGAVVHFAGLATALVVDGVAFVLLFVVAVVRRRSFERKTSAIA